MAKAKTYTKLIKAQLEALAGDLHGTNKNVHRRAEELFQVETGDEVFDQLRKLKPGGIFKCEECDTWLLLNEEDPDVVEVCIDCVNEMNEDEED